MEMSAAGKDTRTKREMGVKLEGEGKQGQNLLGWDVASTKVLVLILVAPLLIQENVYFNTMKGKNHCQRVPLIPEKIAQKKMKVFTISLTPTMSRH